MPTNDSSALELANRSQFEGQGDQTRRCDLLSKRFVNTWNVACLRMAFPEPAVTTVGMIFSSRFPSKAEGYSRHAAQGARMKPLRLKAISPSNPIGAA